MSSEPIRGRRDSRHGRSYEHDSGPDHRDRRRRSRSRDPHEVSRKYDDRSRSRERGRRNDGDKRYHESRRSKDDDRKASRDEAYRGSRDKERSSRAKEDEARSRRHRSRSLRDHKSHRSKDDKEDRHKRRDRRSRSRSPSHKKPKRSRSPSPFKRARGPLPSQADSFQQKTDPDAPSIDPERPNFNPSGLLANAANRVAGTDIVLKYNEPTDSRLPPASSDWRLFVFKGEEVIDTIPLATRSCWLIGREDKVVDIHVENPSASKQHAVVQFRFVQKVGEFGEKKSKVKPYIIDLESSNGTILNDVKIESKRFVEARSGDVMKIGTSNREYVFVLPPKE